MKKGDKVYLLLEEYNFDYEHDSKSTIFLNKEDAYKTLKDRKEEEMKNGWISKYPVEDIEFGCDDYDCFDAYLAGYASQYETFLRVFEKSVQ